MFSFADLKKTIGQIGSATGALRAKIEKAKRAREEIAAAPPTKDDLIAVLDGWVDASAAEGRRGLEFVCGQAVLASHDESEPTAGQGTLLLTAFRGGSLPTPRAENILALLAGPLKAGMRAAVEDMTLPPGIPAAERAKRLAKLDREISDAEAQLTEIKAQADAAGISLESEPRFGKGDQS